jgi:hypothetical protein
MAQNALPPAAAAKVVGLAADHIKDAFDAEK